MTAEARPLPGEAARVFARIGLLSFGGPAAQIALMHRELVERRGWLDEDTFLGALNFCMLLPGPEAMQLATYAGWRLHGIAGGLVAGLLFVLPGAAVIAALAWIYAVWGAVPLAGALFLGIKAAVLVIVIEALLKVARRALKDRGHWVVAALAFTALFAFAVPYPLVILGALGWGFLSAGAGEARPVPAGVPLRRTLGIVVAGLVLWLGPLALLEASGAGVLAQIGSFFAMLAVVTFGGAYAVLAYMAQEVVSGFGWLGPGEMLDALGLAETTPGPLILVTEFVGFLAGYREGGAGLALAAALVTLWASFVPCFLWIFAGAPYIAWISAQPRLAGALAAVTAAVVGVILNLSLWFALHVLFAETAGLQAGPLQLLLPDLGSLDWRAALLAVLSALMLLRWHWGLARVLALAALGGLAVSMPG